MDQLLQIHTVPIQLEIVVTHAKVNISAQPASLNLTRNRGALTVEHDYPRLHIDSSAARSSMNLKNPVELTKDFARQGVQAARDATVRAAEQRHALVCSRSRNSDLLCSFARESIRHDVQLVSAAMPAVPSQISWDPQQLKMQYEKDRMIFDWRINHPKIDFEMGKVEFRVKQYPKTEITYIGRPHYVPPSADPEFDESQQGRNETTSLEATA